MREIVMSRRDRRALTLWVLQHAPERYAVTVHGEIGQQIVRYNGRPVVVSESGPFTSRETLNREGVPANLFEDAPGRRYPEYGDGDTRNVCAAQIGQGDAQA